MKQTVSRSLFRLLAGLLFVLLSTSTWAQQPLDLAQRGTFAIKNAKIVTVSGDTIERGTVVIRDGKIEAVGASVAVPSGAQSIDGTGLSVYPGMIDAATSLGLTEIQSGAAGGVDTTEVGEMNPSASAIVAVNPHSAHVRVTRVNGVTTVVTAPNGGTISGQAAVINLYGTSPKEMALVPAAGLVLNFPRLVAGGFGGFGGFRQNTQPNIAEAITNRDNQVEQLRKFFQDAAAYAKAQEAYAADKSLPRPTTNLALAAMVPYVKGEKPIFIHADRERDIKAAVRFVDDLKLKMVLVDGGEADKAAALLKEKNIPVVVTGVLAVPRRDDDAYDDQYALPGHLQKAGVSFCISTGDEGSSVRDLPYQAGMAAAFGLSPAEALKSVTLYPAQILGLSDKLGSIEPGKVANLVVTDGDVLEARTRVKYLFIDGRQVPLVSRHTELYEQFKQRK
ncbi:MAG: amidohydrolase family protein [Blastocatellia bacterium]|nr:amidohydrolase family protein [Blastocatellia bacterium]